MAGPPYRPSARTPGVQTRPHPGPPAPHPGAGDRSAGPPGQHRLSLDLVQASPDAVRLPDLQRVVEARLAHGAARADVLGQLLTFGSLVLALRVGRWEEDRGLRATTGSLHLPSVIDLRDSHVLPPFCNLDHSPGRAGQQEVSASDFHPADQPFHPSRVGQWWASRAPPVSGSTSRRSPSRAITRTGSPGLIGVARLVRARHGAPRTCTVPSGSTPDSATPISPIIDSRPMVGVLNRVRTMAGIPLIMNSSRSTPRTITTHHDTDWPW